MDDRWHQSEWFKENWAAKVTPEFEVWWFEYYGEPEDYADTNEYFIRASFALMGWLARGDRNG